MAALRRVRAEAPPPSPIHDRALENLRFIRETMERAGSFTAVPGWGGAVMGLTALAAAWLSRDSLGSQRWLAIWLAEAAIAFAIGSVTAWRKAAAARVSLVSGPGRKFVLNLLPPIAAGAILTAALARVGAVDLLPGTWLLLYGTAVVTGGAFSPRIVPALGCCFLVLGTAALFTPFWMAHLLLAVGFGLVQVGFGVVIARRYGG